MDVERTRSFVLSEYDAEEYDHFGKLAFRLKPKKAGGKPGRTFITLWVEEGFAVLMLDVDLQTDLVAHRSGAFAPHPSKWGEKGATIMRLEKVSEKLLREAVTTAATHAARK